MSMSEKNESYLFDLLESMNESLKGIRRSLIAISVCLSLLSLAVFLTIA
jgi:hypothetical protein